jgi:hypothetical protein
VTGSHYRDPTHEEVVMTSGIASRGTASAAVLIAVAAVACNPAAAAPSPGAGRFMTEIVQTFHAIAVGGRWTWILSADQYSYYSAGTCPYAL